MRIPSLVIIACSSLALSTSAISRNLEDVKPVAVLKSEDGVNSLRIALSLQGRIEYGDLAFGSIPTVKQSEYEIYFRRIGFGLYGTAFTPNLKYGLTLTADESSQKSIFPAYRDEGVSLGGTYLQYFYTPNHFIKFGKDKLPLSRVYLTSSTAQLFAERPYYTYAWGDVLPAYAITNLSVGGKLFGSTVRYEASTAKGWRNGDVFHVDSNLQVEKASPLYSARLDVSPPGWEDSTRSDVHMGQGKHFGVGVYGALQNNIDFFNANASGTEKRTLYGADMSFHLNNWTAQGEYNFMRTRSTVSRYTREAGGKFGQLGYFFTSSMLEPVIRYEVFNSNRALNDASIKRATLGINHYVYGNNLKWSLNWEKSWFGDEIVFLKPEGKSQSNAVRGTLQFLF
jgi:hypothetical protein